MDFYSSDTFTYFVLPLLIFLARIFDVSIGTLRIILVAKGKKNVAPILGFFEVLIWIIAIGKIMQNADNIACYIGYAGGFAAGNYIGMLLEERLAMGMVVVRVITPRGAIDMKSAMVNAGFGVTLVDGEGAMGKVDVLFTTVQRADLPKLLPIISEINPKAFYTVEDVKLAHEGVFPIQKSLLAGRGTGSILRWRKGK
jgi:uncharacterized protein YebE (UPF0316 family)